MKRGYRIGAGVRSDDERTFPVLARMYEVGTIDHVQVQVIPEPAPLFHRHIERIADAGITIVIHAPHHAHGVNPCAPSAYDDRPAAEIQAWTESALAETLEAADITTADRIVLHTGRYLPGERAEAETTFAAFLDKHFDPRFILENLPSVYADYPLLGNTAEELVLLGGGRIRGYCLDFPHLYCTANYLHRPFAELLAPFADLPLRLFHLSNSRRGSITDEHLPLDHPDGGLDFTEVIPFIAQRPAIDVSLEYKQNDPAVYDEQVRAFDRIYHSVMGTAEKE
ncbi:TIM barrel protein [Methanofollis fontis]|uniref:Xylose isomerase n=1 Tax=Methanofollis fontis TaxID=2052832 RepID=A0A483CR50_9EURY|nr:TIM barrel protein [Methanofollis fontis]TAJ45288.1 xylose isomerase [Methanofollis fontis]